MRKALFGVAACIIYSAAHVRKLDRGLRSPSQRGDQSAFSFIIFAITYDGTSTF